MALGVGMDTSRVETLQPQRLRELLLQVACTWRRMAVVVAVGRTKSGVVVVVVVAVAAAGRQAGIGKVVLAVAGASFAVAGVVE